MRRTKPPVASGGGSPEDDPDWIKTPIDLTDPDVLEAWIAGELHVWHMTIEAAALEMAQAVMAAEAEEAKKKMEKTRDAPLQYAYLEGQANAYETAAIKTGQAARARREAAKKGST